MHLCLGYISPVNYLIDPVCESRSGGWISKPRRGGHISIKKSNTNSTTVLDMFYVKKTFFSRLKYRNL